MLHLLPSSPSRAAEATRAETHSRRVCCYQGAVKRRCWTACTSYLIYALADPVAVGPAVTPLGGGMKEAMTLLIIASIVRPEGERKGRLEPIHPTELKKP